MDRSSAIFVLMVLAYWVGIGIGVLFSKAVPREEAASLLVPVFFFTVMVTITAVVLLINALFRAL